MVSRFIEEENVSFEEHSTNKSRPHLHTPGEITDGLTLTGFIETSSSKGLFDLRFTGLNTIVLNDELENRSIRLTTIQVMGYREGTDLVRRRETFNLAVDNSPHEGRFAGTVLTAETIDSITVETEMGILDQDPGTVGKGEVTVAKNIAFLLFLGSLITTLVFNSARDNPLAANSDTIKGCCNGSKEGSKGLPGRNIEMLGVGKVSS